MNELLKKLDDLIADFDKAKGSKKVQQIFSAHASRLTLVADSLEASLRRVGEFAGNE